MFCWRCKIFLLELQKKIDSIFVVNSNKISIDPYLNERFSGPTKFLLIQQYIFLGVHLKYCRYKRYIYLNKIIIVLLIFLSCHSKCLHISASLLFIIKNELCKHLKFFIHLKIKPTHCWTNFYFFTKLMFLQVVFKLNSKWACLENLKRKMGKCLLKAKWNNKYEKKRSYH